MVHNALRGLTFLLLAGSAAMLLQSAQAPAQAAAGGVKGSVRVTFKGASKADSSGVVLYLTGFTEAAPERTAELAQRNKLFVPALLPITAGQSVAFPNQDPLFHNVFSPSTVRPFDLGQYRQGESKTKQFPSPGVVDVYCNIHPGMVGTILVLPNRRWATTGADGSFMIEGIPPGNFTLFAWSRYAEKPVRQAVAVEAGKTLEINLTIDETRADVPHLNKFGQPYRGEGYR